MAIEVIVDPMASGKTVELIRRLRRAEIARQKIQVFRPAKDTRGDPRFIETLDGVRWPAATVEKAVDILDLVEEDTAVVGIDEAEFFDQSIVGVCQKLSLIQGKRVIVAGLDTDFRSEPFGPVPYLLAVAPRVGKLTAVCMVCGGEATKSQRLVNGQPARYNDPLVVVGWVGEKGDEQKETYEPRCERCHEIKGIKKLWVQLYGIPE